MIAKDLMSKDFLKIDITATISELLGDLERTREKAAVIFEGKKYRGITTKRLLLKTKFNPAKWKVGKILDHPPTLTGKEPIEEVARLLYTADAHLLPVIEKDRVIGVVKSIALINQLRKMPLSKTKLKDIMTSDPTVVHENDRIGKVMEIMFENKVSRIPVVDDKGNLLNLISFTDIIGSYHLRLQGSSEYGYANPVSHSAVEGKSFEAERVDMHAFLAKNLTTPVMIEATENDTVKSAINQMNKFEITSLVIVKDKKPIGIVTFRDMLKLFLKGLVTF